MIVPPTGLRNWLLGRNDLRRSQSEADLQRESEKENREEPPPPGEPGQAVAYCEGRATQHQHPGPCSKVARA